MTKISSLVELLGAGVDQANDLLTIVDMSETGAARNKKIKISQLLGLVTDIAGMLDFQGSTDCSSNPNYPAASAGDYYLVSVAGKIGGASGVVVAAGDTFFAVADNAGGTQAGVGSSWVVIEGNFGFTPVNKAGDTMTGDLIVPDEVYDEANWNGNLEVPTKNAVRDKFESLSGSFVAASTTEVLTGTDSAKGGTPDSIAALWEQGSDVASAGTISFGEGGYFNITGTTTITDIDFGTDKAGRKVWVKFAGILTLTHNASTLILPTGANIATAAGDTACFVSEGSDAVRCVAYNRASGAALAASATGPVEFIATTNSLTSGSLQLTGLDLSLYSKVDIVFENLTCATASYQLRVTLSTGAAFITTGVYDYSSHTTAASGSTSDDAAVAATGFRMNDNTANFSSSASGAPLGVCGEMTIYAPGSTTFDKQASFETLDAEGASGVNSYSYGGGRVENTGATDGIRVIGWASAAEQNLTGGQITAYGWLRS